MPHGPGTFASTCDMDMDMDMDMGAITFANHTQVTTDGAEMGKQAASGEVTS